MNIKLDSLIPFEKIKTDTDNVFDIVDRNGKVVLLKNDMPMYIIYKYESNLNLFESNISDNSVNYTLQEAMKIVLLDAENKTLHAAELADQIYNRKLYLKKDGSKAQYGQIRARCGHYPHMFEALPGNYIKLKDNYK